MKIDDISNLLTTTAIPIVTPITSPSNLTLTTPQTTISHTAHQTVYPANTPFPTLSTLPSYPHLSFPFQLDIFQQLALSALHLNDNIMVSAHTSSGKTVIAEYAIAMSLALNKRVIYTSPIKALSNQKYRELKEKFNDVGLITGDTTLNPTANCLVMTTEILRNMIYRGNEILKSLLWIIFDEVHYIKEKERGVVWEECIIMASNNIRMVFLSATVPNACEFAEWICEVRESRVHVVYTEKRPTPLEHYLYSKEWTDLVKVLYDKETTVNKNKKVKICEITGKVNEKSVETNVLEENREKNINSDINNKKIQKEDRISSKKKKKKKKSSIQSGKCKFISTDSHQRKNGNSTESGLSNISNDSQNNKETLNTNSDYTIIEKEEVQTRAYFDRAIFAQLVKKINPKGKITEHDVKNMIKKIMSKDLLPTIIFSFSRKECEKYALGLQDDLLSQDEKEAVDLIFNNALMNLRKEDRELPLITNLLPMLMRGIGIHHSGLLPILKEIVEILFQENLVKILFATETFAIGLNMPARSVVFTNLSKFDGEERRLLTSGEYIQMSGRAGRRGIDTKGVVISAINKGIDFKKGEKLFSGQADKLVSAFRLTYNMILNLMHAEKMEVIQLLEKTFFHFQSKKARVTLLKKINNMEVKVNIINEKRQSKVSEFKSTDSSIFHFIDYEHVDLSSEFIEENDIRNKLITLKNEKLNPLEIYYLLRFFEQIRIKRNKLFVNLAMKFLVPGRVVDIFIDRNGSPCFLYNTIIINANKNEVQVTAFVDGSFIKKKFDISAVDAIYDLKVKNHKQLEFSLSKGIKKLSIDDVMSFSSGKPKKNQNQSCITDLRVKEINILADINQILSLTLKTYFECCYYCGLRSENIDCIAKRCFDISEVESKLNQSLCDTEKDIKLSEIFTEESYRIEYERLRNEYKIHNEIFHLDECKKMLMVLRRLEYCNCKGVTQKGRVASEISCGDEILLTEMMFNGDFQIMPVEEVIPLLSCIVYSEWDNEFTLPDNLKENYTLLSNTVHKIIETMRECGIDSDYNETMKKYSYEMMHVVEMWILGWSFADICGKTSIFEGTIIRCFRRLEEILRQLAAAARVIGNSKMESLFADGIVKIKRDIIFANSLYIANE